MQNHSTRRCRAYWLRAPGPTGGVFPAPQPRAPPGAPPRLESIAPKLRAAPSFPGAWRMLLLFPGVSPRTPEQGEHRFWAPGVLGPSG